MSCLPPVQRSSTGTSSRAPASDPYQQGSKQGDDSSNTIPQLHGYRFEGGETRQGRGSVYCATQRGYPEQAVPSWAETRCWWTGQEPLQEVLVVWYARSMYICHRLRVLTIGRLHCPYHRRSGHCTPSYLCRSTKEGTKGDQCIHARGHKHGSHKPNTQQRAPKDR